MVKTNQITTVAGAGYAFMGADGELPTNTEHKVQIITHTDMDGYGAAAVLVDVLKNNYSLDEIIINHHDYNETPELMDDVEKIFITDYSITKPELAKAIIKKLEANVPVFWLDHHESSIQYLEAHEEFEAMKTMPGIRSVKFCGTYLAWIYFHNTEKTPPRVITLIDDYDTFKRNHKASLALNYAFYAISKDRFDKDPKSKSWADLFYGINSGHTVGYAHLNANRYITADNTQPNYLLEEMIDYGTEYDKYLSDYYNMIVRRMGFTAELTKFKDVHPLILMTADTGSMIFGNVLKNKLNSFGTYPLAIALRYKNGFYEASVYSDDGYHPSAREVAEAYGGGGHEGAAGFSIKKGEALPFNPDTIERLPSDI